MNGGHLTSREEREFAVAARKQLGQIADGSPFTDLVPKSDADWFCHARLTCGHSVWWGWRSTEDIQTVRPTRADGSFAAIRCPYGCGRRRLVMFATSHTGVQGVAEIVASARRAAQ